jgi:hypothetical protein
MSNYLPLKITDDDEDNKDFIFDHRYNSAAGAASKPVSGPIHYPDATLKIYPLKADGEKLGSFVEQYFVALDADFDFKAVGQHVYLVVKTVDNELGAMWSESDKLDWWAEQSVQICIPVRWSPKHDARSGAPLALISVYSFSSSNRAAIADREVNGKPTTEAWISGVSLDALANSEASLSHCMSMKTEVFRSFDDGESAIEAPLIEIFPAPNPAKPAPNPAKEDVAVSDQPKKSDVKSYGSLPPEELPPKELTFLTLKQYRDAGDPAVACYQALIMHSYSINKFHNKFHSQLEEEKPVPVQIDIHHYPSHPIVETLGLVCQGVKSLPGADVVYQCAADTHFLLRVSLEEQLGEVIALASQQQNGFIVKENLKFKNEIFKPDEPAIQDSSQNCFSSYKALYEFLADHS